MIKHMTNNWTIHVVHCLSANGVRKINLIHRKNIISPELLLFNPHTSWSSLGSLSFQVSAVFLNTDSHQEFLSWHLKTPRVSLYHALISRLPRSFPFAGDLTFNLAALSEALDQQWWFDPGYLCQVIFCTTLWTRTCPSTTGWWSPSLETGSRTRSWTSTWTPSTTSASRPRTPKEWGRCRTLCSTGPLKVSRCAVYIGSFLLRREVMTHGSSDPSLSDVNMLKETA